MMTQELAKQLESVHEDIQEVVQVMEYLEEGTLCIHYSRNGIYELESSVLYNIIMNYFKDKHSKLLKEYNRLLDIAEEK